MFAQPRLIHNSRVSFYTSRNAYCQEFIDLVLKCPGNLWFIFHLHLRVPEKGLGPGWWRMRGAEADNPTSDSSVCATCWLLPGVDSQSHTISSSPNQGPCLLSTFAQLWKLKTRLQPSTGWLMAECSTSQLSQSRVVNTLNGWCGWHSAVNLTHIPG